MSLRADMIARLIVHQTAAIEVDLERAHVPEADVPDLCQEVTLITLRAAERGDFAWSRPEVLRAFLRTVARRVAAAWHEKGARRELPHAHPEDFRTVPPCEERYFAIETLRVLRESTTPQRWRAASSWARGVPIGEVARRAGYTVAGAYNLIRLAREDFHAALAREDAAVYLRRR